MVVVTNQSGIGRGKYGWQDFAAVMSRMGTLLALESAHIDAVYASPHHEKGEGDYAVADHPDRKPNPGMLLRAARDLDIDIARSFVVGDRWLDVEMGRAAGATTVLVKTGYGLEDDDRPDGLEADRVADNLMDAAGWILRRIRGQA